MMNLGFPPLSQLSGVVWAAGCCGVKRHDNKINICGPQLRLDGNENGDENLLNVDEVW